MSRGVWKLVETKAGEIRMAEAKTLERWVLFQWSNHIGSGEMSFASLSYTTMSRNRGGLCSYKPDPGGSWMPQSAPASAVCLTRPHMWNALARNLLWLMPFPNPQVHSWTEAADRWASASLKSSVVEILFRMKNLVPTKKKRKRKKRNKKRKNRKENKRKKEEKTKEGKDNRSKKKK